MPPSTSNEERRNVEARGTRRSSREWQGLWAIIAIGVVAFTLNGLWQRGSAERAAFQQRCAVALFAVPEDVSTADALAITERTVDPRCYAILTTRPDGTRWDPNQ